MPGRAAFAVICCSAAIALDANGGVLVSGETKSWHTITFDLSGPIADETDTNPNPFLDRVMVLTMTDDDGRVMRVPGYFAADGDAANSSANKGNVWRAHFVADRPGEWTYRVDFFGGENVSLDTKFPPMNAEHLLPPEIGQILVHPTNKAGRDLRSRGRLNYVGERYLRFAGTGEYFLKAGADAPETLLAYQDFDNTIAGNAKKAPLKSWEPHIRDWNDGDPTWQNGKGKGLIGAINYLSGKGCNAFSFLTYNAGGDGDNVWPFVSRDDKLHYDCSKLDQWGIVFEHGTRNGMYLHFKMQETENDDNRRGKNAGRVPESLDGGDLGVERKLYCRELIARFGHNLALNWNLGEENTQSTAQQNAMIDYIKAVDPYDHPIVLHTYPDQQDKIYRPLLGDQSQLTGLSLQNSSILDTHVQTVKWVEESTEEGKPWVVAFDESGSAAHAQCPDLGYRGYDGRDKSGQYTHTQHEVRKYTLWGTLMAGGAGNEYYFGYKYDENDLVCEDWRSRDQSWGYCRIALEFFHSNKIPFWEMANADALVGNADHNNSKYCFAKRGELYLVYLPEGGSAMLDLTEAVGEFDVRWFNPREGGELQAGTRTTVMGGGDITIGTPPTSQSGEDWLAIVKQR